jgi:PAS domain S-box-containing protein
VRRHPDVLLSPVPQDIVHEYPELSAATWRTLERQAALTVAARAAPTNLLYVLLATSFTELSHYGRDFPVFTRSLAACLLVIAGAGYWQLVRMRKAGDAPHSRYLQVLLVAAPAGLWGLFTAVALHHYELGFLPLLLLLCKTTLTKGVLTTFSPSLPLLQTQLVFGITPPAVACLALNSERGLVLAGLLALQLVFLPGLGRSLNRDWWTARLDHALLLLRQETNTLLATAIANAADGVEICDAETRIIYANPALQHMMGYTAAELHGRSPAELFRSDAHTEEFNRSAWDLVRGGTPWSDQLISRRKDGSHIPLEVTIAPVFSATGQITHYVSVKRDNSERYRAASALERSRRELHELIEHNPDAILLLRDERVAYLNPAAASALGCATTDELLHQRIDNLLTEDTLQTRAALVEGGELRLWRRDGEPVVLDVARPRIIDFEGRPASLLVARDVTERRQMQARLEATDRMVSIGTLAAGVAHEINNPLAYMVANLSFVSETLAELDAPAHASELGEVHEALREISDGAYRVRDIVRDLKTFSRSDERDAAVVDLLKILSSAINMTMNEIRHRAVLARQFASVPPVLASASRLGQVFVNLLINAAQAIPIGSASDHEIAVGAGTDELGRAVVTVRDTGCGMPPHVVRRVFDPFFTTKPTGVGTGLGLYICHNIISALGGEITIDSREGKGTTVRVVLPPAPGAAVTGAEEPTAVVRSARILVVDDESNVGRALARMLTNHEVVATTSPEEALARSRSERFDLLLCDLMMPDTSGIDFYCALRDRPDLQARVVFMTGGVFSEEARRFLDTVSSPTLTKPFTRQEIDELLRNRLG